MSHNTVSGYLEALNNDIVSLSGAAVVDGIIPVPSDGTPTRLVIPTYNDAGVFGSSVRGQRYRGTSGTPFAINSGDVLLQVVGDGYDGINVASGKASIAFLAAETWTAGANGTFVRIRTTPTGGTNAFSRVYVGSEGNVGIGTDTPSYTLDVNGVANFASGLYVNGSPVATGQGISQNQLEATGQQSIAYTVGVGSNVSGDIALTGATLNVRITSVSGFVGLASGGLETRIAQTGSAAVSYATTYANSVGTNLSGNLTQTGVALLARDILVSGWLSTGLAQTGSAAVVHANGIGQTLSGNLTVTGQTLIALVTGMSGQGVADYATRAALAATGSSLFVTITGMSGQAVTDYATKTQLTNTGATLGGQINSLSGFVGQVSGGLEVRIAQTGAANISYATTYANGVGVNVSGNLTQTGVALLARDLLVSGWLTTGLAQTGSAAVVHANGVGTNLSGNLTQSGVQLQSLIYGGDTNLSGALAQTGSTLNVRINSLSGYVQGASGALQAQITAGAGTQVKVTGSAALGIADLTGIGGIIVLASGGQVFISGGAGGAGVPSINGITSATTIAGTGGLSVITQGSVITVSGDQSISGALTQTGVILGGQINSLSGFVSQASGGLETRIAQSGVAGMAYANGVGSSLSGNLILTGQTLQGRIDSLSGFSVNVVSGGLEQRVFQSGAASVAYTNGVGTNLSGNLTQTGVTLRALVLGGDTNLSGNLTLTGQALDNKANSLSGFVGQVSGGLEVRVAATGAASIVYANGIGSNISGNMAQTGATILSTVFGGDANLSGALTVTGQTLQGRINSLSGFTLGASGALQAQIAGGGSQVRVSGSSSIAIADFSGIGGIAVVYSGSQILVSGNAGGPGGGVPSVNGITSAVTIAGTGNFTTQTIGSTIYISGSVLTNDQQVLFDKSGITSGDNRIRWDYVTGTLEIGDPQVNYPDNPLSLGGSGVYLQANIRNHSTTNLASADLVVTTDVGNDLTGYLDLGVNNANYNQTAYDIGSGKDGYLYVNDGNLSIGTATTEDVIKFHTAGTRYFNQRAAIDDTGILMPETGKIRFGTTISGTSIDSTSIRLGLGIISGIGLAGKPGLTFFSTGWGNTYYQSAFYDNRAKFFSPNAAATQSLWGDSAANVGTLLLTTSEVLGDYTQITPAAGLSAGLSATTASIFRGSVPGLNGFFFSSKFMLTTAWGTSGRATSSYAEPSGCRIFVGLTDQAVATQVGLNEPAGNMIGLNYLWASGGAVGTGQYMQNWAIRSRNNVATTTGDIGMNFQTGFYRFSMFCRPFPNNGVVEWEMMDLIRGSGVQGFTTGTLPVGSTAMRPMTALGFVSGIKVIGCSALYVEKQGSFFD